MQDNKPKVSLHFGLSSCSTTRTLLRISCNLLCVNFIVCVFSHNNFFGNVIGDNGRMVIEFTECILSSFVDRSIFDRLLLGRGKEYVLFNRCRAENKEIEFQLLSNFHFILWAWAFFLFPTYIRYSTCVTLKRGRPSYPNPF
jgi:hypothetical protein